jgi:hypothetical protein
MKSSLEVLAHIERLYERYLASPRSYASDPRVFEQILSSLEDLREFILDVGSRGVESSKSGYTQFLIEKGYGAKDFTSARYLADQNANSVDDLEMFNDISSFWRQFLQSPRRFHCPSQKLDPEELGGIREADQ